VINQKILNLFKEISMKENEVSNFDKNYDELIKDFLNIISRLYSLRKENNYLVKDKVNFKPGRGAYLNISN
jgi:hypothetical protein